MGMSTDMPAPLVAVIVEELPGAGDAPERLVARLGGHVQQQLPIINGFRASVPEAGLEWFSTSNGVARVTRDSQLQLQGGGWEAYNPFSTNGSMFTIATDITGADAMWSAGYTGEGVTVALIDSGVVPVNGLTRSGKVINGLDISFESQAANLRYLDTYGHGTHMAGIIAGKDDGAAAVVTRGDANNFLGMAPDASILNVKVADSNGAVDVSQVIAAIAWVVQHRDDNGMNVRVLNLSFGTNGTQAARLDPLAQAVEVAWKNGIVVVVAAGNDGNSHPLRNPALDPFVIAVGASDNGGNSNTQNDTILSFSNCGTDSRHVDLVAPGKSVISIKSPGSTADLGNPLSSLGTRFMAGSGTSQGAAVVSGAVALLIEQRPSITADQVKELLTNTAASIPGASSNCQGAGLIDLAEARTAATPTASASIQNYQSSTGKGSLEAARGSAHVTDNDVALTGENDIFGAAYHTAQMASAIAAGNSWSGGTWNGNSWSGNSWSGNSWSGNSWSGNSWSGNSWSGNSWSSHTWSGNTWSGNTWSGNTWSGATWSGNTWSGNTWSGLAWA